MDIGSIKIKGLYGRVEILDLYVGLEKNKHAEAFIKGIIFDEEQDEYIARDAIYEKLTIVRGEETEEIIFSGFIKTLNMENEGDYCIVWIYGISASVQLDGAKKFRSFQNISCTVQDIIRKVLQDTQEADAIFNMPNEEIGAPLIQYDETDWEFIIRICSLYHTSVFVDIYSGKPHIYCGIPEQKNKRNISILDEMWEFDSLYYSFLQEYSITKIISKWDFLCARVCSYDRCRIGEEVSGYENRMIEKQECRLRGGILEYVYNITARNHAKSYPSYNENIRGASILGTILDVNGEEVKLWLEIDEKQETETAYWYKWMPESGNVFYCMPEIGAKVYLYIGEKDERYAIAIGCRHGNFQGGQDRINSARRSLKFCSQKDICMFPDMIEFSNGREERNSIEIEDCKGLNLESDQEITICAENVIRLSGKKITFQAPEEILMVRKDIMQPTVINMSNQFDAIGRYMDINANGKLTMIPVIEKKKDQQYSLKGIEEDIIASTPYNMDGQAKEIEKLAVASKVNVVVNNSVGRGESEWEKQRRQVE